MRISYTLTENDREAFAKYWQSAREYRVEFWLWRFFWVFERLMIFPSFGQYVPSRWEKLPTRPTLLLLRREDVKVSESGVEIFGDNSSESFDTDCIQRLGETNGHFLLKLGARTCVIPKQAFDSDEGVERFRDLFTKRKKI